MSVSTIVPCLLSMGTDFESWTRVLVCCQAERSTEIYALYSMICSLCGTWLGAFAVCLDWDQHWQVGTPDLIINFKMVRWMYYRCGLSALFWEQFLVIWLDLGWEVLTSCIVTWGLARRRPCKLGSVTINCRSVLGVVIPCSGMALLNGTDSGGTLPSQYMETHPKPQLNAHNLFGTACMLISKHSQSHYSIWAVIYMYHSEIPLMLLLQTWTWTELLKS